MEWWNSIEKAGNLSKFALSALKNAQQKIDAVLDIQDTDTTTSYFASESHYDLMTEFPFSHEDNLNEDVSTPVTAEDVYRNVDSTPPETPRPPMRGDFDCTDNNYQPPPAESIEDVNKSFEISNSSTVSVDSFAVCDSSSMTKSSSETDLINFVNPAPIPSKTVVYGGDSAAGAEDDLDTTTTGSDIEVLSGCTSTNGDTTMSNALHQSPQNTAAQPNLSTRPISINLHKSFDSFGIPKAAMLKFDPSLIFSSTLQSHRRAVSQDFRVGPVCPNEEDLSCAFQSLSKNYADKKKLLKVREAKILQLIQENCELRETNSALQSQLTPVQSDHLSAISSEFSERLAKTEQQLRLVARERDQLKSSQSNAQQTHAKAASDEMFMKRIGELERQLAAKTHQLEDLLKEGEQMSREQLRVNNGLKKLHKELKDSEERENNLTTKVEQLNGQLQQLQATLSTKENVLSEQTALLNRLNKLTQTQESELSILKLNYSLSESKVKELEQELESFSNQQLALENELKQTQSQVASHALVTESEQAAREAYATVSQQLDACRAELSVTRSNLERQAEQWREERDYYQTLLAERTSHVESLGELATSAAQPALIQFQAVQSTLTKQTALWEEMEKNWNLRIEAAEHDSRVAKEAEQATQSSLRTAELKNKELALALSEANQKHTSLAAEVAQIRLLYDKSFDNVQELTQKLSITMCENEKQKSDMKRLRTEWSVEKDNYEMRLKETARSMRDSSSQMHASHNQLSSTESSGEPKSPIIHSDTRLQSVSSSAINSGGHNSPVTEHRVSISNPVVPTTSQTYMEYMQSLVHLKEGECKQLRRNNNRLTETQEKLLSEIASLTTRCERLARLSGLEQECSGTLDAFDELQRRYDSLLLLYGRVTEQNNELRMDLIDIKEIYRRQIDMLVQEK